MLSERLFRSFSELIWEIWGRISLSFWLVIFGSDSLWDWINIWLYSFMIFWLSRENSASAPVVELCVWISVSLALLQAVRGRIHSLPPILTHIYSPKFPSKYSDALHLSTSTLTAEVNLMKEHSNASSSATHQTRKDINLFPLLPKNSITPWISPSLKINHSIPIL